MNKIKYDKYGKEYYENYALLSLIKCFGIDGDLYYKCEHPDWVNVINNIGLEVTRAVKSADAEKLKYINSLFGRGYDANYVKNELNTKRTREHINAKICDDFVYVKFFSDIRKDIKRIAECIRKKSEKLRDVKEKYKQIDLYVFCGLSLLDENDIERIINELEDHIFTNVYFNCVDKIYISNKKRINYVDVSDNLLKYLKQESCEYKVKPLTVVKEF